MSKIVGVFFWAAALLLPQYLPAAEPMRWTAGRLDGVIRIDGRLDEPAWQNAIQGGSFAVHGSYSLAEKETEAIFLWDQKGLYAGVRAWETDLTPGSSGTTVRDSGVFDDDHIELFLKSGESYRHYAVTSLGVQYDALGKDSSADWQWEAACDTADGNRREFEIFIPWEAAGFTGTPGGSFQFLIARFAKSIDELSVWQPWFGGFHDAPELFPEMILGENPSGNFKVDPIGLQQIPAVFAFAEPGDCNADGYELRISPLDPMYGDMTARMVIPQILPPDKYFLRFSVFCNGEAVYIQNIPWLIEAPEVPPEELPFFAELVQPWFENETEVVLDYVNGGGFESAEWRIADADGQALDSGSVPLEEAGKIFFPMPETNGDYKLQISSGTENLQLDFTKAEPVGTPRQWFAVGGDGILLKDGTEPVYPLIYYALSYDDMVFARKIGADLFIAGSDWWHSVEGPAPGIVKQNLGTLDLAGGLGIPVAAMICNTFRGKKDFASLRYTVARMKNHPYLAAWYLADEPALYKTDPAVLEKAAEIIHEIDPVHPIIGCEVKTQKFGEYQRAFDMFGVDPYPGFPGGNLGKVDEFIAVMERDVDPDRFQFVILQGFGKPFSARHPNRDETLNMVLQVLASGADGICWWTLEHIRQEPDGYLEMAEIINSLKPLLAEGNVETIRQGDVIIGLRPGMMIAVNKSAAPAKIFLPYAPETEIWKQAGEVSLSGTNLKLGPQAACIWLLKSDDNEGSGGGCGKF